MSSATKPNATKSRLVSVGVREDIHEEMKHFVGPKGMKLTFLVPALWENWKLSTPEQTEAACKRLERRLTKASA